MDDKWILKILKDKEITQKAWADAIGISEDKLNKCIKGVRKISLAETINSMLFFASYKVDPVVLLEKFSHVKINKITNGEKDKLKIYAKTAHRSDLLKQVNASIKKQKLKPSEAKTTEIFNYIVKYATDLRLSKVKTKDVDDIVKYLCE